MAESVQPPPPPARPARPGKGAVPPPPPRPAPRPPAQAQAPAPAPAPGYPPPVQVTVEQASSNRLDPVVLVELAYKYGISVVFACVLLAALLYYANRLDDRSLRNAHDLASISKSVADIRILQSAIQQDLARIQGRPPPAATAYPGLTE